MVTKRLLVISPNYHPRGSADKNKNWDKSPEDCLTIHVTLEVGFPAGRMSRLNLILSFKICPRNSLVIKVVKLETT